MSVLVRDSGRAARVLRSFPWSIAGSTKKALSGLVLGALCAAAVCGQAQAQSRLTVARVADDFALIMLDYGQELGLYQKHGLDVQLPVIASSKAVQAMIGGSVDLVLGSGSILAFAAKGAPFKAVAAIDGPPKMMVVVVPQRGRVQSVADLKGSAIGATSKGSLTDWGITQLVEKKDLPDSSIRRAYVGDTAAGIAAMRAGVIDAAVIDVAAALDLQSRGEAKILLNLGDVISDYENQVVYATNRVIADNPDAVRRFLAAFLQTIAYARQHPEQTQAFARKELKVSDAVSREVYDLLMAPGFFSTDGRIEQANLEAMSKSFAQMKVLPHEVNLSAYVDQSLLPDPKASNEAH